MAQKVKPFRSEPWRRFIASLPCCCCGSNQVQAAHIRSGTGGGMGYKPEDKWCIPLCIRCHAEQHRIGERVFWGSRIDSAKQLAINLYESRDLPNRREACLHHIANFKNEWGFQ